MPIVSNAIKKKEEKNVSFSFFKFIERVLRFKFRLRKMLHIYAEKRMKEGHTKYRFVFIQLLST